MFGRYFKGNKLDYPSKETSKASKKYVNAMKLLPVSGKVVSSIFIHELTRLKDIIPPTTNFNKQFLDLLRRIFVYDPSKRMTAKEALKHPWFNEKLIDDGTEAARIRRDRDAGRPYVNGYR